MRVLVVEDEAPLRAGLVAAMQAAGYVVQEAADGQEGLFAIMEYPCDLAVVDLGLPLITGMELIRRARAAGKSLPLLVLTARDRWQDKVEALQAGADDYVTKPFHVAEVMARVQALLRRAAGHAEPILRAGVVAVDPRSQSVTVEGQPVELTAFEYRLLEYLVHHAGEVVTKTELAERLYPEDAERDSNTVEVFVGRLRRKLDPQERLHPIETLRGRGYRLVKGP
jgi:two-component system, OmpR family, response regulator PhoP